MISGNETWSRRRMAPHGAPWHPWPLARLRSRWSIQTKHPHARCLKMRGSSMTMQQEPISWRYLPFLKAYFSRLNFREYPQNMATWMEYDWESFHKNRSVWEWKIQPPCTTGISLKRENDGNEDEPLDVFRSSHSSASPRKVAESTTYPIGPQAPTKRFITQLLWNHRVQLIQAWSNDVLNLP